MNLDEIVGIVARERIIELLRLERLLLHDGFVSIDHRCGKYLVSNVSADGSGLESSELHGSLHDHVRWALERLGALDAGGPSGTKTTRATDGSQKTDGGQKPT